MSKRQDSSASIGRPRAVKPKRQRSMRLNIFKIEPVDVPVLKAKFDEAGLTIVGEERHEEWSMSFWLTQDMKPHDVSWLGPFEDLLNGETYYSINHAGAYVLERGQACFVVSFGTAFHHINSLADPEFGLNMARRVGDERQVKQRALRRFGSKRRKEITSFAPDSGLFLQSGEAVDLVKLNIRQESRATYGKTGQFGRSFQVGLKGGRAAIPIFCDRILATLDEPEAFDLPMIVKLDGPETDQYDQLLLDAVQDSDNGDLQLITQGHEVVGVDFVFAETSQYALSCPGHGAELVGLLDIDSLRTFIATKSITRDEIFNIRVEVSDDNGRSQSCQLKAVLDYVVPGKNVTLDGGDWKQFNKEYLEQLDVAVDELRLMETEPSFMDIRMGETAFNDSAGVQKAGYESADQHYDLIGVKGSPVSIEAYDLYRDGTVYAVKFGAPAKLSYVCAQAMNVTEIVRNNADDKDFEPPRTYCLWLGLHRSIPTRLSELGSITLKQRLVAWTHACDEVNMEPAIKLSRHHPQKKSS